MTSHDRWGRYIPAMEAELAAAHTALDAAAAATSAAFGQVERTRTDAAERKAWSTWEKAHAAQNRAARRLHAANQALGHPPLWPRAGA
jgi:hypothetical protein